MKIVIDACSIILLAKASVLEVCAGVHHFCVTKSVFDEVLEGKKKFFADAFLLEKLVKEKKIFVEETDTRVTAKLIQDFRFGEGEASTVAFGIGKKEMLIATDNKQGRKAAQIYGLSLVGSIEIIVSLYIKKKINKIKAKEAIKKLQEEGWFHPLLIERAMEDIEHE